MVSVLNFLCPALEEFPDSSNSCCGCEGAVEAKTVELDKIELISLICKADIINILYVFCFIVHIAFCIVFRN